MFEFFKREESEEERELSPEAIEQILQKNVDINQSNLGYTVLEAFSTDSVGSGKLEGILENGILGASERRRIGEIQEKEDWAKNVREKKDATFWFNITGRGKDVENSDFEVQKSEHFRWPGDKVAILFSLDAFKEDEPDKKDFSPRNKHFSADDPFIKRAWKEHPNLLKNLKDSEGKPKPFTKYGFVGSFRVAPRFFKGIVFKRRGPKNILEDMRDIKKERVEEIARIMLEAQGPESGNLIPIYDDRGNMWWPVKMSHDEIKKKLEEAGATVEIQ